MWQAIGASAIGSGHIRGNLPCQDAHQAMITGDYLLIAIADGLGTAAQADKGAQLAVSAALAHLQDSPISLDETADTWLEHLRGAFAAARTKLEEEATHNDVSLREYNTTLIATIVHPTQVAVGHLGDGAVIVQQARGDLVAFSLPQNEEYANEVMPLTHTNALSAVRYELGTEPMSGIALFTDGLQTVALHLASGVPHQPFFTPFFQVLAQSVDTVELSAQLDDFLQSERVCQKTDDDKTLVVATWLAEQSE